jgi:hypothetical protein
MRTSDQLTGVVGPKDAPNGAHRRSKLLAGERFRPSAVSPVCGVARLRCRRSAVSPVCGVAGLRNTGAFGLPGKLQTMESVPGASIPLLRPIFRLVRAMTLQRDALCPVTVQTPYPISNPGMACAYDASRDRRTEKFSLKTRGMIRLPIARSRPLW